jgi:hypothetical protein
LREWLKLCAAWGRIIRELRPNHGKLAKLFASLSLSFHLVNNQDDALELYPILPIRDVIAHALGYEETDMVDDMVAEERQNKINGAIAVLVSIAKQRNVENACIISEDRLSVIQDSVHCESQLATRKVPNETLVSTVFGV